MEEFKMLLKEEGLTQKDFAELMGLQASTVYDGVSRGHKRGSPTWLKAFVVGYELGRKKPTPSG